MQQQIFFKSSSIASVYQCPVGDKALFSIQQSEAEEPEDKGTRSWRVALSDSQWVSKIIVWEKIREDDSKWKSVRPLRDLSQVVAQQGHHEKLHHRLWPLGHNPKHGFHVITLFFIDRVFQFYFDNLFQFFFIIQRYIMVTLTTLEKRFKIPSRTTGKLSFSNHNWWVLLKKNSFAFKYIFVVWPH